MKENRQNTLPADFANEADARLTGQQSLDLISQMIERTRQNFSGSGGAMFLIWGYTTVAVTAAVTLVFLVSGSNNAMWLWWVLPVAGWVATWLHFRRRPRLVTTHLDKAVWSVWIAAGIASMACALFAFLIPRPDGHPRINVLFTIALVISVATMTTGGIIRFKPVTAGSFVGMILSFAILAVGPTIWQMPLFAGVFLVAQIVPGHLLNASCRREARRRAKEGRAE